jgi:hypothetical protein
MAMPISALFLPIDFGPGFPQSWGHFFDVPSASRFSQDPVRIDRIELSNDVAGAGTIKSFVRRDVR